MATLIYEQWDRSSACWTEQVLTGSLEEMEEMASAVRNQQTMLVRFVRVNQIDRRPSQ